ncbi:ArsR family transcriptional regulator [Thiothrix eikelboomii]|uniref:ArsR family transcriptional regulator n=1 Tax=Thiothrix eikelboomii TaxID=92487 RepID=A0A1T4WLQ0_9GAMM|nr:metalloregulator ArsR/SmtB family transcription factor [Thiothrix eikelboomii]SKA78262.1 ArsR family transcriptional regulator [Thiothrix eikelboomii]
MTSLSLEVFTKALADQTRLRILSLLVQYPELCVCELTEALGLAQPKISRHLAILREASVLQDRKLGLWVHYQLHPQLSPWAQAMLKQLQLASQDESIYQEDSRRLQAITRIKMICSESSMSLTGQGS